MSGAAASLSDEHDMSRADAVVAPSIQGTTSDPVGFYTAMSFGISFTVFNLSCCVYVFYRTFTHRRHTGVPLPPNWVAPLYIAMGEFITSTTMLSSILFTLAMKRSLPDVPCEILGGLFYLGEFFRVAMTTALGILQYIRTYRKKDVELGTHDWKLVTATTLCAVALTSVAIKQYGSDTYWCAARRETPFMGTYMFTVYMTTWTSVCILCYRMHAIMRDTIRLAHGSKEGGGRWQAARKMAAALAEAKLNTKRMVYLKIYLLHVIPLAAIELLSAFGVRTSLVLVFFVSLFNLSGIGNAMILVMNEGWRDKRKMRVSLICAPRVIKVTVDVREESSPWKALNDAA